MDNETTAKEAAGWHRGITYQEKVVCGVVIERIILSLHVSRSMAVVLVIEDARVRANENVWLVW